MAKNLRVIYFNVRKKANREHVLSCFAIYQTFIICLVGWCSQQTVYTCIRIHKQERGPTHKSISNDDSIRHYKGIISRLHETQSLGKRKRFDFVGEIQDLWCKMKLKSLCLSEEIISALNTVVSRSPLAIWKCYTIPRMLTDKNTVFDFVCDQHKAASWTQ